MQGVYLFPRKVRKASLDREQVQSNGKSNGRQTTQRGHYQGGLVAIWDCFGWKKMMSNRLDVNPIR